jgi:hypothetical protein
MVPVLLTQGTSGAFTFIFGVTPLYLQAIAQQF